MVNVALAYRLLRGCTAVAFFALSSLAAAADDGAIASRAPAKPTSGMARLTELEKRVGSLEKEVEKVKADANVSIDADFLRNRWFLDFSAALQRPFAHEFTKQADLGIGATLGIGRYLGGHQSILLALDYDIYVSATLKYRLEWHFKNPYISVGPFVGVKQRLWDVRPFDNYIDAEEVLPATYMIYGFGIHMPLVHNVIYVEVANWDSNKDILIGRLGFITIY